MKIFYNLILILFFTFLASSQVQPKREFRGAWIATVTNLDWPSNPTNSIEKNKSDLILLLDNLKAAGVNAVIFQIRTECDAFYNSPFEPWSYWLTGSQGSAPNPYWDPLEFAISESHKRGIEIHAWFNPYRAVRGSGYQNSSNHVSVKNPNWILTFGTLKMLNPGLPEVRSHVIKVIMDVARRYDVDGIHWDDYFYPYPSTNFPQGITNEDLATFNSDNRGFFDIKDWRRDNINLLIKSVHDSLKNYKKNIKFGISPFGIYKNGVPNGIVGLDAYNILYTDVLLWLQNNWLDYFTPQLYWGFGGGQDYTNLMLWWATQKNNRHFYPGLAPYRITDSNWPSSTVTNQIRLNRSSQVAEGEIFFRANQGITNNPKGFLDSLQKNLFNTKSISPIMSWNDNTKPNTPQNLRYTSTANNLPAALTWDSPQSANDGDIATFYTVYRFMNQTPQPNDFENPQNIFDVTGEKFLNISTSTDGKIYFYAVSSLDRSGNESLPTNTFEILKPNSPNLILPENFANNITTNVNFVWNKILNASSYNLEISETQNFATLAFNFPMVIDTILSAKNLLGQKKYFWRVQSINAGGRSDYSLVREFATIHPSTPKLIYPNNYAQSVPTNLIFKWEKSSSVNSYQFQLATNADFSNIAIDSTFNDTTLFAQNLLKSKIYFWRVRATNNYGISPWSEERRFLTSPNFVDEIKSIAKKDFMLMQNYPNPFNPKTTIDFYLWKNSFVRLSVYDLLGRVVESLQHGMLKEGKYSFTFKAEKIPSGIYYYRLQVGDSTEIRKMIYDK